MQTQRIDEEQTLKYAIIFEDSVSIAEDAPKLGAVQPPSKSDLISDLCDALKKESTETSLGYLKHGDYSYDFRTQSLSHPQKSTTTTLGELLEANALYPYEFPAEKRAIVATILASSLLQLQKTHWISDTWSKRDVFFTTVGIAFYPG